MGKSTRSEIAERRARVLELYNQGADQRAIATMLAMPRSTVALDLKSSPGYRPRRTLMTFETGDRITAHQAANLHGLTLKVLLRAIDNGTVRGKRHRVAGGRVLRTVDPVELGEDLGRLPVCAYDGCDRKALAGGACNGAHARALATKGTKRPGETCRRISAGKTGKPRPDVRDRLAAMHADPATHYDWGVALAEGRQLPANSLRRWKGRREGLKAARAAGRVGGKRPVEMMKPKESQQALELYERGQSLRAIARITGLTKRQLEGLFARAKLSP